MTPLRRGTASRLGIRKPCPRPLDMSLHDCYVRSGVQDYLSARYEAIGVRWEDGLFSWEDSPAYEVS